MEVKCDVAVSSILTVCVQLSIEIFVLVCPVCNGILMMYSAARWSSWRRKSTMAHRQEVQILVQTSDFSRNRKSKFQKPAVRQKNFFLHFAVSYLLCWGNMTFKLKFYKNSSTVTRYLVPSVSSGVYFVSNLGSASVGRCDGEAIVFSEGSPWSEKPNRQTSGWK